MNKNAVDREFLYNQLKQVFGAMEKETPIATGSDAIPGLKSFDGAKIEARSINEPGGERFSEMIS